MKRINITSAKMSVVFPEGKLPAIDPNNPEFLLLLGSMEVRSKVNAKAARKLVQHRGGAVLQGKLVNVNGMPNLIDAGFSWLEPKFEVTISEGGASAGAGSE